MNLFRLILPILFPSWNFFDRAGPTLRLEFSTDGDHWQTVSRIKNPEIWSRLLDLFVNPSGNESLFQLSLAERLAYSPEPALALLLQNRLKNQHELQKLPAIRISLEGKVHFTAAGNFE